MIQSNISTNSVSDNRMIDIIRNGFKNSSEVYLCVSFLRFSGLGLFLSELKEFLGRNGKLKFLTSTYLNITQPETLKVLMNLNNAEIRIQNSKTGFHAKFYFFGQNKKLSYCWVGSSNLTKGGLVTNIEWNLRHDNPTLIYNCKKTFDLFWYREDVFPLTLDFVSFYTKKYKQFNRNNVDLILNTDPIFHENYIFKPNEAQEEALQELKKIRQRGDKKAVVIAATGLGKTFLAAFDAKNKKARNLLFIAHREELLKQAKETFDKVFNYQVNSGILAGGKTPEKAEFIFATIQSISKANRKYLVDRYYDYVVIDEFHHAAANTYKRVLQQVKPRFLLGLTATPERKDGHDVLEICDNIIAYEVRLPEAINRNWLLPFHYFGIADDMIDYSKIQWRNGKFNLESLETALVLEERVDQIITHALEKGYDGKSRVTVGFCAGVRHAKFMSNIFNKRGLISQAVTGEIKPHKRQEIYKNLADINHPLEWVFVSDLLNEGVDIPEINSILFLRPTESPSLFLQQLGRGLRLHPDIEVLTVLDFVGNHKNAWLNLKCLNDPNHGLDRHDFDILGIIPPKNCEIILEEKTKEILQKIKSLKTTKKERIQESYNRLKDELERPPKPVDFWGREEIHSFQDLKTVFKTWLNCRKEMNDATEWELNIQNNSSIEIFLKVVEQDWQMQRVIHYAVLWSLCYFSDNIQQGVEQFFLKYPHWRSEKPENSNYEASIKIIEKKLNGLLLQGEFLPEIKNELKTSSVLAQNIEERIQYTLAKDYHIRHCGILRKPKDLILFSQYSRYEIINHFGIQYDPTKHNLGYLKLLDKHLVVITKLDTSGAHKQFQYKNQFINNHSFSWQSQNKMKYNNSSGKKLIEHKQENKIIHLFVQPKSREKYFYIGVVEVIEFTKTSPMMVTFQLLKSIPESVFEKLLHYSL